MGYKKLIGLCVALKDDPAYHKLEADLRRELDKEIERGKNKFDIEEFY